MSKENFLNISFTLKISFPNREKNPIPICIVDEAAQVDEINILKPLSFGVKKLVLLGDTHKISQSNISLSVNFNDSVRKNSDLH